MLVTVAQPVSRARLQERMARSAATAFVLSATILAVDLAARGPATGGKITLASVAVGIASIVVAVTATKTNERRSRSAIMFGVLYPVYFGIIFGWSSLTVLGTSVADARVSKEATLAVFPLVLLALFGWWAGYKTASTQPLTRVAQRIGVLYASRASSNWTTTRVVAIYAVATLARLFLLAQGSYGYLADLDRALSSGSVSTQIAAGIAAFAPLALLLLAIDVFRRATLGRVTALVIATGFEIVLTGLSAQKNPFLLMGLSLLLAGVAVGRLSWKAVAIGALVGIVIIFPFNTNYRSLLRPEPGRQVATSDADNLLLAAAVETQHQLAHPVRYLQDSFESAGSRLRNIDDVAVAVDHHSSHPYDPSTALLKRTALLSVPRIIWPSKPVDLYALKISRDYYRIPNEVVTASSLSIVGDGYRYGGNYMVVVALFYIGVLCRFLDVAFDHRVSTALLVPIVAAMPILHEGDIAGMTVRLLITLLFLLPVLWFLSGRDRRIVRPV